MSRLVYVRGSDSISRPLLRVSDVKWGPVGWAEWDDGDLVVNHNALALHVSIPFAEIEWLRDATVAWEASR